nr:hypothetical protein [Legionella pneumophila]
MYNRAGSKLAAGQKEILMEAKKELQLLAKNKTCYH